MNCVVIEEHQVGNLVFAQCNYLYISLKATSACIIVPIAKVLRSNYSSYEYWKHMDPIEHQQIWAVMTTQRIVRHGIQNTMSADPTVG